MSTTTTTHGHYVLGRDAIGARVVDLANEKLGTVEDLLIDPQGRVVYAILAFGGLLGLCEKLFPVPWSHLHWREGDGVFALQHHGKTRDDLRGAPHVKAHETKRFDPSIIDRQLGPAVHSFYPGRAT